LYLMSEKVVTTLTNDPLKLLSPLRIFEPVCLLPFPQENTPHF
jgi:hypothetical protein